MKRTKKWTRERVGSQTVLDAYTIGDRVRLLEERPGIPAETLGKVVKGSTNDYYAVLWDGTACPRGMYPDQIALVEASTLFPEMDPYE